MSEEEESANVSINGVLGILIGFIGGGLFGAVLAGLIFGVAVAVPGVLVGMLVGLVVGGIGALLYTLYKENQINKKIAKEQDSHLLVEKKPGGERPLEKPTSVFTHIPPGGVLPGIDPQKIDNQPTNDPSTNVLEKKQ